MEAEIRTFIPNIDPILSEYSVGYLHHASNIYAPDVETSGFSPLDEAATSMLPEMTLLATKKRFSS